jgi:YD repeat-containing protein
MGQTIRYDYDPNGNVTLRESPNGAKRRYVYDAENRLTEERHYPPGSETPSKTITYAYDQRGLLTAYDDGKTSGSYEHDLRGLRVRETIRFGTGASAITKTLERRYRANGQLESLTYPQAPGSSTTRQVDFAYNGNNQLETLTMPGSAGAIGYSYRWQSVDRVTYPGGIVRQITLDPLQRIEGIQVGTQSEPTGILDHRYRYDEVSNIREKDTREGRYVYGYDNLDRLTEATPPVALQVNETNPEGLPVERYRYDRVHNRLESEHQPGTWIYNANNELQSYGTGVERRVLSYDANGSTVKEELGDPAFQVMEYVYDPQDRLIEVKRDGALVHKSSRG